jgi:hypothetical protein
MKLCLLQKWSPAAADSVVARLDFVGRLNIAAGYSYMAAGLCHTAVATCSPNTVEPRQPGYFEDVVVAVVVAPLKIDVVAAAAAVVAVHGPLVWRCNYAAAAAAAAAAASAEIGNLKRGIDYNFETSSLVVV